MNDLKGAFNVILKGLIVKNSLHIQEQRTKNAIFHLLYGKRSIQTVQDAHLFQLGSYYGLLPMLTKQNYEIMMQKYITKGLLKQTYIDGQKYIIPTLKGKHWLNKYKAQIPLHYFNGLRYFKIDYMFLERLMLLIQVLTNRHMNNSSFIPVINRTSIINWVKQMYPYFKQDIQTCLYQLYDDLYALLSRLQDKEASLFLDRLTGYKHYGMSIHQLANKYNMSTLNIKLYLRAITHRMLRFIKEEVVKTRILSILTKDLPSYNFMTKSAQLTYNLLQKQYSVHEIARLRQLKMSTINDHMIEIAWYDPHFPVHAFIEPSDIDKVEHAIKKTHSLQLKTIKDAVGDELTYFQIRLALTRAKKIFTEGILCHDK